MVLTFEKSGSHKRIEAFLELNPHIGDGRLEAGCHLTILLLNVIGYSALMNVLRLKPTVLLSREREPHLAADLSVFLTPYEYHPARRSCFWDHKEANSKPPPRVASRVEFFVPRKFAFITQLTQSPFLW
jgi:hypothetical protein